MALQTTGPISLADIQGEFGGSNPISISEYYGVDTGVPASGTISIGDFYGKSAYTPMSLSFSGGVGTSFAPGCTTVSAAGTVSVSGGVGPYSYAWTRTSGTTTPTTRNTLGGGTSDSLTASQYLCPGGEASGTYSVVVTDSTNTSVSTTVVYTLLHSGGSFS